ncbi:MAG: HD domain-containing protein [Acidimicrobiales bacterium]
MHLTVDDIEELLASGAGRPGEAGASYTHLDHALQTAAVLRSHGSRLRDHSTQPVDHRLQPDGPQAGDPLVRTSGPDRSRLDELVVAGLVHDIGHLLPGIGDAEHAEAAAAGVRRSLGERVADLVGLHVEAKRYLVASEAAYGEGLSAESVTTLGLQGGPMSADERVRFESLPLFVDALALRRADDQGKVEGLVVDGLETWMQWVRRIALS